jgi:outer membrane receptor protein involved in Fe transport
LFFERYVFTITCSATRLTTGSGTIVPDQPPQSDQGQWRLQRHARYPTIPVSWATTPNLTDWDGYGYDLVVNPDGSIRLVENDDAADGPPKSWSVFGQDKFEREGVIVNGGLRFDHINVDTPSLRSEQFPLGDPDATSNVTDSLETQDLEQNKTYTRISPRLGVAFPVDEKTILRFNYGQFYQQPNLQDLYVSYRFEHKVRAATSSGSATPT